MTTRTGRWAVVAAVLIAATTVLSGCGGRDEAAATAWQEPARYTYVLESACGERALIGRFRITVDHGRVTAAQGLDEPGRRALETTHSDPAPTLSQLLDEAEQAWRQGGDVETSTDPADGHPTEIKIDPEPHSIDDESCYTITSYTP